MYREPDSGGFAVHFVIGISTSFLIWKDEAFQLWLDEWACLYEADSVPHRVIREIRESYYLMNVVENNFIDGDIFHLFERLYSIPSVGRI